MAWGLNNVYLLKGELLPAVVIDNIPNGVHNEKFILSRDKLLNTQHLITMIEQFENYTLPLLVKSGSHALLPEVFRGTGNVIEISAISFNSLIQPNGANNFIKDYSAIVFVYSPYCGASAAVYTIINKLAIALKDDTNFVVAKFDKIANDIPLRDIPIFHYPTTLLFTNDGKILDFDDYNGSKLPHDNSVPHTHYEFDNLIKFVKEHHIITE